MLQCAIAAAGRATCARYVKHLNQGCPSYIITNCRVMSDAY